MSQATGDNITRFPAPPEKLIDDEWIYQAILKWRIARASQLIAWAKHDEIILGGYRSDDGANCDTDALDTMQTLERNISDWEPQSALTATAMLGMAIEILAYQEIDPEHAFASGPVLEILRNCKIAIERLPGTTQLKPRQFE